MDKAVVIFFEDDKYKTVLDVLFSDLREDPDVFFVRDENLDLSDSQKDAMIRLDALLGGVFLTSDDPSQYTDDMISRYREYRGLMAANNVTVSGGLPLRISYSLAGRRQSRSLFKNRGSRR